MEDEYFMAEALREAERAEREGEVPIGAVLVRQGSILAQGHNRPIGLCDPTAHAEIDVLRQGARLIGNYRLNGCRLYVTLEPCLMCVGAMMQARIAEMIFGAPDEKNGAVISKVQALDFPWWNHAISTRGGVLEEKCRFVLQDFFKQRRSSTRRTEIAAGEETLRQSPFSSGKSEEDMVKE